MLQVGMQAYYVKKSVVVVEIKAKTLALFLQSILYYSPAHRSS
jgi:hypothetical protein